MNSVNQCVREYTVQLKKGEIQVAYKGILTFMNEFRTLLENTYPSCSCSAVYPGYLDMTYFACTPAQIKERKLKIAIVYLHEEAKFEIWLAANNRAIQKEYMTRLLKKDTGNYTVAQAAPGVDAILISAALMDPDFDQTDHLKKELGDLLLKFTDDVISILEA